MKHLITETLLQQTPFVHIDYQVIPGVEAQFVQETALYFVQSWMSSNFVNMQQVFQNWNVATQLDKEIYESYLKMGLFPKALSLIDDPTNGNTAPIGTFSETMLRWIRQNFGDRQLIVEPNTPQPSSDGKIDFIEITDKTNGNSDFRVTMWEVKSSDSQVHAHNSKIYKQLSEYPIRFFAIANSIAENYTGNDLNLKNFLRNMAPLVKNRDNKVQYGVFVTYDANIPQDKSIVPSLHKWPSNHPSPSGPICHFLYLLAIPDFKNSRMELWKALHLV